MAQSYLETGAKWTYNLTKYNSSFKAINEIKIIGDTLISGKQAKTIQRQFTTCDDRPQIDILLEEDNKLFHFDHDKGTFRLLFDYNAQQNDTLNLPVWESLYTNLTSINIVVDSVTQLNMNGQNLKQFHVTYLVNSFFENDIIIEHIGSMTNLVLLIEGGFCHGLYNNGLRCFEHPTLGTFSFVDTPCDFIENDGTAVDDDDTSKSVVLSPNPATDEVVIEISQNLPDAKISFLNMQGTIVQCQNFEILSTKQSLDISKINSGCYVILIESMDGKYSHVARFIKI